MYRRRSLQPSRRAVLHVQAAGDPAVSSGLGDWFTERAFHFYLAGVRLGTAAADLDAACARLRDADGIGRVIVAAHGRAALAAALWSAARSDGLAGGGADALIMFDPALPSRPALSLNIACPVLVLTSTFNGRPARSGPLRLGSRQGRPVAPARLGSHVTWLQLPDPGGHAVFDELGRWLGAYMYGSGRDQLL